MTCTAKPIPAALIETLVLKDLHRFFEDENNLINLLSLFQRQQAEHHASADSAIASHRAELASVRKALSNTANAIADLGGSAALLKKLTALEAQENELQSAIAQLERQKTVPIHVPTPQSAKTAAARILADLKNDDPAAVRQTLLGIVHQILADRHGKRLVAQVELYFDKKKETGGNPTVPISHTPVGAPIYRHSLKIEYDIQRQGNPLPIK